jgi:hypothetical protein
VTPPAATATSAAPSTAAVGPQAAQYEVDVTTVVKGNGTFSFGATSSSTDGAYYDSRESGTDAPQLVVTTGDNVYDNGTTSEFNSYYQPTWGAFKAGTRPAPGNHDYNTSGATGYYGYFGSQAGPSGQGYYSYNLGNWHIVSLNSNISMTANSAQVTWLRDDPAANTRPCTLACWHHPLFTSGANHAPSALTRPLYQALSGKTYADSGLVLAIELVSGMS